MIPGSSGLLRAPVTLAQTPTRTFRLSPETGRVGGLTDGLAAMALAVYILLGVERYQYVIHSPDFGTELSDLFGRPVSFVLPELRRRITESLLQDDRITGVDNFSFDVQRGRVHATFTVHTAFGALDAERTVETGV